MSFPRTTSSTLEAPKASHRESTEERARSSLCFLTGFFGRPGGEVAAALQAALLTGLRSDGHIKCHRCHSHVCQCALFPYDPGSSATVPVFWNHNFQRGEISFLELINSRAPLAQRRPAAPARKGIGETLSRSTQKTRLYETEWKHHENKTKLVYFEHPHPMVEIEWGWALPGDTRSLGLVQGDSGAGHSGEKTLWGLWGHFGVGHWDEE